MICCPFDLHAFGNHIRQGLGKAFAVRIEKSHVVKTRCPRRCGASTLGFPSVEADVVVISPPQPIEMRLGGRSVV